MLQTAKPQSQLRREGKILLGRFLKIKVAKRIFGLDHIYLSNCMCIQRILNPGRDLNKTDTFIDSLLLEVQTKGKGNKHRL